MSHAWTQTYTGIQFRPFNPLPEDVKIIDIAHALSMQCRFNGHIKRFYSVAEHSFLMSYLVSPAAAPLALLHDAAEAYIGDMPSPLKDSMTDFKYLDLSLTQAILARFGVGPEHWAEVHAADKWIVHKEARVLMNNPELVDKWGPPPAFKPALGLDYDRLGMSPDDAKYNFLLRYRELFPNTAYEAA